jgi:hypothetical protein
MQIQIQLFISMRIRIQKAKLMRIHAAPDPGQPSKAQTYRLFLVHSKIEDPKLDPDPKDYFKSLNIFKHGAFVAF